MSFKKWLNEYLTVWGSLEIKKLEKQGVKIKGNNIYISNFPDEIIRQMFVAYKNDLRTKSLVIVTWVLAIATIILSGLTIYFQHSN